MTLSCDKLADVPYITFDVAPVPFNLKTAVPSVAAPVTPLSVPIRCRSLTVAVP